jgi:hypothetical protein
MRIFSSTLTGLAAAALLGVTAVSSAQDPVRVRKEAGGQIILRVDTIVRVDTVTRVDTVSRVVDRIVTRVDTVTVIDTVMLERSLGLRGFYWGVNGGANFPSDNFDDAFDTGWSAGLMTGWRVGDSPWGIRLDGSYNQLNGTDFFGGEFDDASIWSGMLNATFDIPPAMMGRSGIYLTSGIGIHGLSDFDFDEEDFDIDGDGEIDEMEVFDDASTEFGYNVGLGFRFGIGRTALLLEGRFVNIFTEGSDSRFFPVTLGFVF